MRLHRFYIGTADIREGMQDSSHKPQTAHELIQKHIVLDGTLYKQYELLIHQWRNVFKYTVGSRVILFDDQKTEYECLIEAFAGSKVQLAIVETRKSATATEFGVGGLGVAEDQQLWMFISILKGENFDLVIQKLTELGVNHIVPLVCDRTIKKSINYARGNKIATEAAEQSGRLDVPVIYEPVKVETAIQEFIERGGEPIVCHQKGDMWNYVSESFKKYPLGFVIGPEGGWSEREEEFFRKLGLKTVNFSVNVLRAETAAIGVATLAGLL